MAIGSLTDGVFDQALERHLVVLAWSPLAGGRLLSATDSRAAEVMSALAPVAERAGVAPSAAALAWVMAHPARPIPIVGSQTPSRILESRDALGVTFSRAEWYSVLVASRGEKLP